PLLDSLPISLYNALRAFVYSFITSDCCIISPNNSDRSKMSTYSRVPIIIYTSISILSLYFNREKNLNYRVCVKLFSEPFSPQYFKHSIFVRFFGYLPRECLRLVPRHFKLRSKTKNLT